MLPHPRIDKIGMSPLQLMAGDIANLHESQVTNLVSPPHSAVVYRLHDIHVVFLALLLIQVAHYYLLHPVQVLRLICLRTTYIVKFLISIGGSKSVRDLCAVWVTVYFLRSLFI